jgi:hypothetical protein
VRDQVNPEDGLCVECWRASPAYAAQREYWRANRWRIIITFVPCLIAVFALEAASFFCDCWREVRPRNAGEAVCMAIALIIFPLAVLIGWFGWFGGAKF